MLGQQMLNKMLIIPDIKKAHAAMCSQRIKSLEKSG